MTRQAVKKVKDIVTGRGGVLPMVAAIGMVVFVGKILASKAPEPVA